MTLYSEMDTDRLTELKISNSTDQAVRICLLDDGRWEATELDLHLFTSMIRGSGVIRDSLWNAATRVGVPPEIILNLADLFGWQVDFTSGLREGDSFDMYFTNQTYKDFGVVAGKISAARFTNNGNNFYGFAYTLPDGTTRFYDKDGNSMKRAFLKTPLQYRYISSGFSRSRFHPVLKIYRPHLGIDYAAPKGTPVSALGDGVIVMKWMAWWLR